MQINNSYYHEVKDPQTGHRCRVDLLVNPSTTEPTFSVQFNDNDPFTRTLNDLLKDCGFEEMPRHSNALVFIACELLRRWENDINFIPGDFDTSYVELAAR